MLLHGRIIIVDSRTWLTKSSCSIAAQRFAAGPADPSTDVSIPIALRRGCKTSTSGPARQVDLEREPSSIYSIVDSSEVVTCGRFTPTVVTINSLALEFFLTQQLTYLSSISSLLYLPVEAHDYT